MSRPTGKTTLLIALTVLVGAGLLLLGRVTAGTNAGHDSSYQDGRNDGYAAGLRVGEAQGRQEGRALQEGTALAPGSRQPVQDAFNAGYVAGANDAFGGYDGGWALGAPYLVVLESGTGQVTYRIATRTTIEPNVDYYLCPNGRDICQQPRP